MRLASCILLTATLGLGCRKADFVDSSGLGPTSFLVVIDEADRVNRILDPSTSDGSLVTQLSANERLVAMTVDDVDLDRRLPGMNRMSGEPIQLAIEAPPTEPVPPYPASETFSMALPDTTDYFRTLDGQFNLISEPDNLPDVLRPQLTLRVPWDPEFCRDPNASSVRPFFGGRLPESYQAKPIRWLDDERVLVGLHTSLSIRVFTPFLLAAIIREGEVVTASTIDAFCQNRLCLNGKEDYLSWAPLSASALGDTHIERLGAFATYDDPEGVRWVVMVRTAAGKALASLPGANFPSLSYLDFFRYEDGELMWDSTVGGFGDPQDENIVFGSIDIDSAGRIAVGVNRSEEADSGTEEIWVFERFGEAALRVLALPSDTRLKPSSPVNWTNDPAAALVVGAEGSPPVLLALDQSDCTGESCWTSWKLVDLEDGTSSTGAFRDFDVDPGTKPGLWIGGDGSNLYRYDSGEGPPSRRSPLLPPRFSGCGQSRETLGDIRVLAAGENYVQLGVDACALLLQVRKSDQCVSLVNPDPQRFATGELPDNQGVRSIDIRNGRVVFGGLDSRLFVFP